MDANGYPTSHELKLIREWPMKGRQDALDLIEYVRERWKYADYGGFSFDGSLLNLSTAGWSGNEDVIGALSDNAAFWLFHWGSSRRGGHYVFEIRKGNDGG